MNNKHISDKDDIQSIHSIQTALDASIFMSINDEDDNHRKNQTNITYDSIPEISTIIQSKNKEQRELIESKALNFNLRKLARSIPLPTTDAEIKIKLREINEPIILFGEKPYERSDRLRQSIESLIEKHKGIPEFLLKSITHQSNQTEEAFYTEGSDILPSIRTKIALYSLPRSSYRIALSKQKFFNGNKEMERSVNDQLFTELSHFEFSLSQIGDERECSRGAMSPDGNIYGVAGWSGICNIFSVNDNLKQITKLYGHSDRVNSITFHPGYGTSIDPSGPCALTASDDSTIRLWSMVLNQKEQKSLVFNGHEHKVNYAEYHPMGTLLGSCSTDKTIRLWDIMTKKEILLQEGHSSSVNCLSFQSDGALLASADQGGIGLVWDLRSGKIISTLLGHARQISSLKFASNSYCIASGSDDNTLRYWDLRRNYCLCTIPAHTDAITDIQFDNSFESRYAITTSFDSKVKIWNTADWSLIKSYDTNEDKILSVDLIKDCNENKRVGNRKMITASLGKKIKLWESHCQC